MSGLRLYEIMTTLQYMGVDWKTAGSGIVMASSEYGTTMIIIHTGGKRYPIMVTFLASHEEIGVKNKIANLYLIYAENRRNIQ